MKETLTCLIPAGGEGIRLRPHTFREPKPMLLMGNPHQRIIDFPLRLSLSSDHTIVTTNYKAEIVENHTCRYPNIIVLRDLRKIGAASLIDYYHIFSQEDPSGDIVVLPADQIHENFSLTDFQQHHQSMNVDITLLVVPQKDYGECVIVKNGFAEKIVSKPMPGSLSTTGIYMIKNSYLINWMKRELEMGWNGEQRSMYRDIVCPAVGNDKVAVFSLPENGYWDDAGTLRRYYANNMRLSLGQNVISPQAKIEPAADIVCCVVLGDPILDAGVKLRRAIVSGSGKDLAITEITE